jgi:hypothetical protein
MAELALDHNQRHAFARHFDRVRPGRSHGAFS